MVQPRAPPAEETYWPAMTPKRHPGPAALVTDLRRIHVLRARSAYDGARSRGRSRKNPQEPAPDAQARSLEADDRDADADAREADASARDVDARRRGENADVREVVADARGVEADLREVVADARTVAADAREADAEARESSADVRGAMRMPVSSSLTCGRPMLPVRLAT